MRIVSPRILAGTVFVLSLILTSGVSVAQTPNLQKFYLGGQVGYSWEDVDISTAPPGLFANPGNFGGFIGGVHGGANFYQQDGIVIGIVGDFNWLSADGGSSVVQPAMCGGESEFDYCDDGDMTSQLNIEIDWKASIRGKIATFVAPETLVYATAGVGFAGLDASAKITPPGMSASDSQTLIGLVVGGGVETLIAPDISMFVQALYYNFGEESLTLLGNKVDVDLDEIVVQVGLSFYLN